MKLIIDIGENIYQTIVHTDEYSFVTLSMEGLRRLDGAIRNGKPLPEGHGRLIDADQYKQTLVGYIDKNKNSDDIFLAGCGDGAYHAMCMLKDISTIVEADGGSEDEIDNAPTVDDWDNMEKKYSFEDIQKNKKKR